MMFVLFVYLFDNFEPFSLIEPNIELYWKLVAFACIYMYIIEQVIARNLEPKNKICLPDK